MFMRQPGLRPSSADYLTGTLIFLTALLIFWFSPVHQITDSNYSMLLSEALLKQGTFALDNFNLPRLEPKASTRDYYVMNGDIWQLELAGGHIYYYFPPGSSLLSLPAVGLANLIGVSAVNPEGTYNPRGEMQIETSLAAVLMALLASIFYFTSRLTLDRFWSVSIALSGALGTQIWSTASRGLWSHTWAALLAGLLVWIMLADETGRRKINPILLASLLAWLYFVRPTGSVTIFAITVYLVVSWRVFPLVGPRESGQSVYTRGRKEFLQYAITGMAWLTAFFVYSWIHFGKLLPSYYQANRLRFDLLPVALAGNLFSPSRGFFVYVPLVLFAGYLLARYWKALSSKRLVWLALAIFVLHLLSVSAFANLWGDWWGGASFGPRYSTELVPWLVLTGILGLNAARRVQVRDAGLVSGGVALPETHAHSLSYKRSWSEISAGVLLLAASVFINARGAISLDTWKWSQPSTDQQLRAQLWDWAHPQFLAGLTKAPPPVEYPLVQDSTLIDFTSPEANRFLWYGWSGAEKNLRWSDGHEATVVFSLNTIKDMVLDMKLAPFLASPRLVEQKLNIKLNGRSVGGLTLSEGELRNYSLNLPQNILARQNVLAFEFPDATAPASLGAGADDRLLGIKVQSMQFR